MLLNGKTIGASGAAGSLGIKYAPKFRPARRIVPLGAPGGTSVEASLKLRQGTRVKVVEREPDAISRRAVLGGAAAACACGSLLAHDQGPLEGKTWDSPLFAEEMALGMRDYEARLRPLKCALFTGGAEGGPDFTLPTAAAAAPSATSPPPARGLVSPGCRLLEIGVGAAPNFRYYSQAALVTALEPNLAFHPKIRDSAVAAGLADRLRLVPGTAERMPFESASFDVVVGTMMLCSVEDVRAVVAEVRRVLRPGGTFVCVEHVAAPTFTGLWALQSVLDPLQQACFAGCHLARDPLPLLEAAGFRGGVDAARFTLCDPAVTEGVAGAAGAEVVGRVRAAAAAGRGGGGWDGSMPPPPHFLLSPHLIALCTA